MYNSCHIICVNSQIVPFCSEELGSKAHVGTKVSSCSYSLCKTTCYLHRTYAHPPKFWKQSTDYLQYTVPCAVEITGVLHYVGKCCEIFDHTVKLQGRVNKIKPWIRWQSK